MRRNENSYTLTMPYPRPHLFMCSNVGKQVGLYQYQNFKDEK